MIPEAVLVMASALPTQDFRDSDVRESAVEIARAVTEAPRPLFKTREMDAAVLLTTAYAEARFVHGAIGDGGGALCEFQLHDAPRSVLTDLGECVDVGYERLRLSVRMCREFPLAQYIGGCDRHSAQWQSDLRLNIARRILSEAQKRREFRSPEHLIRDMMITYDVSDKKTVEALKHEWPYEPGWYETNIDGFMCSGDPCISRDAPALPRGSNVWMNGGIGEVLCIHCYYERRRRLSRAS